MKVQRMLILHINFSGTIKSELAHKEKQITSKTNQLEVEEAEYSSDRSARPCSCVSHLGTGVRNA